MTKNKSQLQNFKDTARKLECDESEEAFDAALNKIAKAKPKADPDETTRKDRNKHD